jgi:hypothetical protein
MSVESIDKLVKVLVEKSRKLNEKKLAEVLDFVDFLAAKHDGEAIKKEIVVLAEKSKSFEFLVREPDIYSLKDVK